MTICALFLSSFFNLIFMISKSMSYSFSEVKTQQPHRIYIFTAFKCSEEVQREPFSIENCLSHDCPICQSLSYVMPRDSERMSCKYMSLNLETKLSSCNFYQKWTKRTQYTILSPFLSFLGEFGNWVSFFLLRYPFVSLFIIALMSQVKVFKIN